MHSRYQTHPGPSNLQFFNLKQRKWITNSKMRAERQYSRKGTSLVRGHPRVGPQHHSFSSPSRNDHMTKSNCRHSWVWPKSKKQNTKRTPQNNNHER